jgi:hypothetical protein
VPATAWDVLPATPEAAVRITLTSIYVPDQEQALRFYTDVLGFLPKDDVPVGE